MSTIEALTREAEAPPVNPYLVGNYAPVHTETTAWDLPVEGVLPAELEGRYVRIGPNPVAPPDPARYHWFTGSGMVHGLRLRGGRAEWYRNRYVVSDTVAAAMGRPQIPGPRNGFGDNTANTNVLMIGDRLYAIVEAGGLPVELTFGLESVARSDLSGSLPHGFSAHPKADPATGEMHVMTYQPGLGALSYLRVGTDGRATHVADVPAPHCPMVHDTAFTANHVIVLDLPVVFNFKGFETGFPFLWDPERTPRVGLLPRSGDLAGLRWFEAPSSYVFHVLNAYEADGAVVIDVARHPRMFDQRRNGPAEGRPALARWTIDLASGRLAETILDDRGWEFPRLNDAFGGRKHRYGYFVGFGGDGRTPGPLLKYDFETGRAETHDFGPGRFSQEPVFVPRRGGSAEDDGWILAYVHDAGRDAAEVVVLEAADFTGAPAARVRLPVRVPFGFHGNFLPDPA